MVMAGTAIASNFQAWPESNYFADPHVEAVVGGPGPQAVRNDLLIRADRVGIQAVMSKLNQRRSTACGGIGKGGTGIELIVCGQVAADLDIVWNAGIVDEHWRERERIRRVVARQDKKTVMDVEAGATVILARVAGVRGKVEYSAGVTLGIAVSVEAEETQVLKACFNSRDDLVLAVDRSRLILINVRAGRCQRRAGIDVGWAVEKRRGNVVRQILMHATTVEISHIALYSPDHPQ